MRCWLLQGKTTIGSWERFSLAKLTKSDAIGKYHLTRDAEFDVCALQLCVIIYDISLERLVPSFQYTTASSWQYTTSVSTMRSSSRGAERKRKRKRGDLKWRQGISIGQHSSDTYVLWRSISGFSGCLSGKRSLKNLEQDNRWKEHPSTARTGS